MPSTELTKTDIRERGLREKVRQKETLHGLAEIAAYLDCSIGTVRGLVKQFGMPATNFTGEPRKLYFTTKFLIHTWIANMHFEVADRKKWVEDE